ncbi:MAG: hypothetical protein II208_04075 [Alphaproteobacteria bacterium]|nr:hypothetical protein [Alphaproteobacteria bacterium]
MKAKIKTIAQRLLNLYRQEHVIVGGWAAINPIFVNDATEDVIAELNDMPAGRFLVQHIENLRSGKTPMDSIERELLPYGGMMSESIPSIKLKDDELQDLEQAIEKFTPDQAGLDMFLSISAVRRFGEEWPVAIRSVIDKHPKMLAKWDMIKQTFDAYRLWDSANEIVSNPLSDRARALVQADMPDYETYLPKFGVQGIELLEKLRTFISTLN